MFSLQNSHLLDQITLGLLYNASHGIFHPFRISHRSSRVDPLPSHLSSLSRDLPVPEAILGFSTGLSHQLNAVKILLCSSGARITTSSTITIVSLVWQISSQVVLVVLPVQAIVEASEETGVSSFDGARDKDDSLVHLHGVESLACGLSETSNGIGFALLISISIGVLHHQYSSLALVIGVDPG